MRARRILLGCLVGLVALVASAGAAEPAIEPSSFRIVGYLPEYRAAEFDLDAARCLTDLIVFSAEPTPTGQLDLSRINDIPWAKLRAFKTRHRVRLILCVGGAEFSTHFPAVAGSDVKRREFAKAAVAVCLDKRLDGVDLDWEHPQNAAEEEGYGMLLAELHQAFEPHGLTLSVTLAGWQKLPRGAFDSVDWVNVMAYDHPGQHSTLEAAQSDVKKLLDAGAPTGKITLGLPFYGRDTKNPDQALTYREILAKFRPGPEKDEIGTMYLNGPATIRRKVEYALKARLAGVMIWELGQDAPGDQSLLNVIRATVDGPRHKSTK